MKKFKKFFSRYKILLSALLVAAIFVGGTLAYLVATDSPVTNTFSLANVGVKVEEGSGTTPEEKVSTIKNTGKSDAFVRARVVVSAGVSHVEYVTAKPASLAADTIYVVIGGDWTRDGNELSDYYYYNAILPATGNTSTTALVNGVYLGENVDSNSFHVDVYAESVLASGTYTLNAAKAAFESVNG